ncbi:MAG: hypothetical protein ACR2H2_14780 [Solirubrobacteraceae bacterium]
MSRYIDEHRGRFGVEPICRVLDVSASAYYQRASGGRAACVVEDERLTCRRRAGPSASWASACTGTVRVRTRFDPSRDLTQGD